MSATLEDVTKKRPEPTAEQLAAEELVRRGRDLLTDGLADRLPMIDGLGRRRGRGRGGSGVRGSVVIPLEGAGEEIDESERCAVVEAET